MNTTRAHKAVKAGRLAVSAEQLGNDDEAHQAGKTAGALAAAADMTLAQLDAEVGRMCAASIAWSAAVDAWYEAQPADVTDAEVDAVLTTLRADSATGATASGAIVVRMWAEIQRRRGL